ncbi:uncharacterized protein LODBEIA_P60390 [Lodderomyces beijingensis]|uniref:Efficient mitochondria targeting-associated protein 19 n=1 Tax=Lodderomyces beijingensis TaxID=1775926 RepID=A0ABP0ZUJ9_9ASCO
MLKILKKQRNTNLRQGVWCLTRFKPIAEKMWSLDALVFGYYLTHIPVTLVIDASVIIPKQYHSQLTSFLVQFHTSQNKDIVLLYPQIWFKTFILVEVVFQLPLFVYFCYKYLKRQLDARYYAWSLIYGFNASFTTFVCMVYICMEGGNFGLSEVEAVKLVAVYSPYLFFPLVILVHAFQKLTLKAKVE